MPHPRAGASLWMPILGGAVLGPALQVQQERLWTLAAYVAIALAAVVLPALLVRRLATVPRRPGQAAVVVLAAAVAFALTGARANLHADRALPAALEGRDLLVTGTIASMPQASELGPRFRFRVEQASDAGAPVTLPPVLSLAWYSGPWAGAGAFELQRGAPDLRAGDRWRFAVRLRAPHGHANPHGFDFELWLWEQGVQATGYVRAGSAGPAPQRLGASWRHPVEQLRQQARDAIHARLADRQAAGVVAALVVGDQAGIDRADWDVFRATGVAHLMSISGLHVTMFAWLAAAAIGAGWRRSRRLCLGWPAPHAALCGGLLLAGAYALFSGWGVPAQRTLWMLGAVAALRLSGRQWPWPVTWLFACAVVVTLDPWALLQAGFWLSFVAVGVLFATDRGGAPRGWRARLAALMREQAIVTVALAPLTLLLFGQVSLVGLVANLAAIPWVTLVVTPLAMAGLMVPPLWDLAAAAVLLLAALLGALAQWPFAVWTNATPPLWAGVAGVLGGLLLVLRLPPPVRALGLPLLLPAVLWQAPRPAPGEFELLAADIGQGNAVIVRTASRTLVYDTGPRFSSESDAGQRVLVPLLRALGERVDQVVLSHRDSDHTGGAASVLAAHPAAALVGSLEDGHPLSMLRTPSPCLAGATWDWDGVRFEFLHPSPADLAARKPNATSCVLRVASGGQAALLAGDIEQAQEKALVDRGVPLRAQVLLVPHHGSNTSSSAAFVHAVQPRWAVVQAGYRNRFGHPAAAVVERLEAAGATVVASAWCGAAWWSSAQPERMRCQRQAAPRYWHHRIGPDGP